MGEPSSRSRDRRVMLLGGTILAPALVLALLSWRSLRQEREERRGELLGIAQSSATQDVREIESELRDLRERAWKAAGSSLGERVAFGRRGEGMVCARNADGTWAYPRALQTEGPSLEERIARENPDLLQPLSIALEAEFGKGNPAEASAKYASLEDRVEAASTRSALDHARARACLRSGDRDGARRLYERLSGAPGEASAESGIPYSVLAAARLVDLDGTRARWADLERGLAERAIPGSVRVFLLQDLDTAPGAGPALARARALERLEHAMSKASQPPDELARIDDRPFLLSFRVFPEGSAGTATELQAFPSVRTREAMKTRGGVGYEIERVDAPGAPGEVLTRVSSAELPTLAVSAHLVDPSRLEVPKGRLVLTGGLVACLTAALLFGMFALLRTVRRELAIAQMKSDFVSGVSHDLKTPLTSIRMFAEMLDQGKAGTEEKRREYHRLIHRESLRLSRLVEKVLDFARIEEGRKTYAFSTRPLREVVASAAEIFRAQVEGQDLGFGVDLSPESMPAKVDSDAVEGAILNLLENGLKYGGDPPRIELGLARRGAWGEISVEDHGAGIPEEEQDRLFEKFYRGASAVRGPVGGAGLGLSLVKAVAEAHGGTVSVRSEPGRGSRFTLLLPLCSESSS